MKPLPKHLKLISLLFSIAILAQGCSVYTYKPTTVDEAIKTGFTYATKVKTKTNEIYIFDKIERENELIFGFVKKNSFTGQKTVNQDALKSYGNYLKIPLEEDQIKDISVQRRDKTLSTVVPILSGVVIIGGLLFLIVDSALNNLGGL